MVNRIEQVRTRLQNDGKKIVNLSSGNPGEFEIFFPTDILQQGFQKALQHPAYIPDPKGNKQAREAIARWYQPRGLSISPEQIILTSGTSESYLHLFQLLAKPGDEILFPNPGYPLFEHLASMTNIVLKHYHMKEELGWQTDPDEMESKISPKTRAIVLISPNNPTGSVLTEENILNILRIAKKYHLPVISDEVFSEFMYDGKIFPRPANFRNDVNIFTLSGISKTYALPGFKLGWIVATGPNAARFIEGLEITVDTLLSANQITQTLLPDILDMGENFLVKYRKRLEKNRNLAMKILRGKKQIKCLESQGGFYLFPRIDGYLGTDEDFAVELLEKTGIFVHPGYFYDYEKSLHVLISFLMEASVLQNTLEKMIEAMELA